ncbi:MAG: hypothetical protein CVU56_13995 [Deltaproteobacteria bacterium HGW-Deltaproteobacteria-14]|nr:MAG: hypothetical protein CVU56_13995 [Deltaproteobacteria bacterium HGW-Deltaproteobacteria-14]
MAALAAFGVAGCVAPAVGDDGGARVAIDVAPLTLDDISNATYTLTVLNGAGALVWSRQVTSSAYGDGGGSVSYVGPCDADPDASSNKVQVVLDKLTGPSGDLVSGVDYINPAPAGAALEKTVVCQPNQDAAVTFDITFARAAQQGFFDVAVQFEDIFCSAKLDCQDDQGQPIKLLFDDGGQRAATAIFAFACTGGAGADTWLYLSDLSLDCGGTTVTVDPSQGPGLLSLVSGSDLPNAHLFDALVSRGSEQLGAYAKRYWNVALGLTDVAGCTLHATGTASDGELAQNATPAGSIWPYVDWTGSLASCTRHAVNGSDGVVSTQYTGFAGATFAHAYHGEQITIAGAATLGAPSHWADGAFARSCDGYRHPTGNRVYGGQGDGYYTIDPAQDGNTLVVSCDMTTDGGGWTLLTDVVAATLDGSSRVYLYRYGTRWYQSPATTLAWTWSGGQELTGTYAYFDGTSAGTVDCTGSSEKPGYGVGCSSGGGNTVKVLPSYTSNAAAALCDICQDTPNAFGGGVCQTGVAISFR